MANKNSFLMYMNWAEILADPDLSEEDAGALIKAICCAQLGEEYQVSNPALKVLAKSWLKKMQADADSYERKCEKNREAASKGRKEKQSENERTLTNANERYANANERKQTPANDERTQTDTDTETDTDTGTDTGFDALKTKEQKEKSANADQKKAPKGAYVVYADEPELDIAIKDFIDHRKKLKKPMTDKAIRLFLGKLDTLAADMEGKVKLIDNAIEHGWLTVYPDKEAEAPRASPGQSANDYLLSIINSGEDCE